MKHKAVESMVRIQFNIPDDVDVSITFLAFDGRLYEFEAEWWEGDLTRHQCNCRLPHLNKQTQIMAA